MKKMISNYDKEFDILYISVVPNEPAIGSEDTDGVVVRRSRETGEFIGITIFDFKKRLINNDFEGITEFINPSQLIDISQQHIN